MSSATSSALCGLSSPSCADDCAASSLSSSPPTRCLSSRDGSGPGVPRLVVSVRSTRALLLAHTRGRGGHRVPGRPRGKAMACVAARRALAGGDPGPLPAWRRAADRRRAPASRPAGRAKGRGLAGDGPAGRSASVRGAGGFRLGHALEPQADGPARRGPRWRLAGSRGVRLVGTPGGPLELRAMASGLVRALAAGDVSHGDGSGRARSAAGAARRAVHDGGPDRPASARAEGR